MTGKRLYAAAVGLCLAAGAVVSASPANAAPVKAPAAAPAAPVDLAAGFHRVDPVRVLDTRTGLGAPTAPLGPGGSINPVLAGVGSVPALGVAAVVLNLTAVAPTAGGFLTVYPAGSPRPTASSLNFAPKQTIANQVIATIGASGRVTIFNSAGSTNVIADVTGWYSTDSYYTPLNPARVLDTRTGNGAAKAPVGADHSIDVQISGRGGVPADGAVAVAVNVTGTHPTSGTFVTVYPTGEPRPGTSNLNLAPGQTAAVMVVATLGTGGRISLYNNTGTVHLVADVTGWYSVTGQFTPLTPLRVLDTRKSQPAGLVPRQGQLLQTDAVAPPGGYAAVISVTVLNPTASGFLTVMTPSLDVQIPPTTSTVNFGPGQPISNLAIADVLGGSPLIVNVYTNSANTQLVVDVQDWFVDAPAITPTGLPDATVPAPYAGTLVASGGRVPFTWSVVSGTVPPGLTFTPAAPDEPARDAFVRGTPTTSGTSTFTVRVTDARGLSAEQVVTLTVRPFVPGAVWSVGAGLNGELGNGSSVGISPTPVRVADLSGVTAVAGGFDAGYALRSDGTVWAWGLNREGQLGDGTLTSRNSPVQVLRLTGITAIAGGDASGYAVRSDGTVWDWGRNGDGELGIGTTAPSVSAGPVPELTGVTAVAAGALTAYALKSDGTVWAWGANTFGQLGDGSNFGDSLTPVRVSGLTGVTAIAAGEANGYALKSDGTVWAWGITNHGALGGATSAVRNTPAQVPGLTGITAIVGGDENAFALRSDGTVWAWGLNNVGQLGDGTTTDRFTPVSVPGVTGATAIAASDATGYALMPDGTVRGWGDGSGGALGAGATSVASTATELAGLPPVTAVAAGGKTAYLLGTS